MVDGSAGYGEPAEGDYFAYSIGSANQDSFGFTLSQTLSSVAQGDKVACSAFLKITGGNIGQITVYVGSTVCAQTEADSNGVWVEASSGDSYVIAASASPLARIFVGVENAYTSAPVGYVDGIGLYNPDAVVCSV